MILPLTEGKVERTKKGYIVIGKPNLFYQNLKHVGSLKVKRGNNLKTIYQQAKCPVGQKMPISSSRVTKYNLSLLFKCDEAVPLDEY